MDRHLVRPLRAEECVIYTLLWLADRSRFYVDLVVALAYLKKLYFTPYTFEVTCARGDPLERR